MRKRIGQQLLRMGTNSQGQICVQIILNIPLKDLIEVSIPEKELKK